MSKKLAPKHALPTAVDSEASTSLGGMTVFGIVAGGTGGLVAGLAQYNAIFVGKPAFALPAIMTIGGGILGTAVLGGLGWCGDKLLQLRTRNLVAQTPVDPKGNVGAVYPRAT
jgi:hypothetical protein